MRSRWSIGFALLAMLLGCTPNFTREQSLDVAEEARLLDDVEIERGHHRRITRGAHICLVADEALPNREAMLQVAQRGLAVHFAAVGIEPYPLSYLEMVEVRPCAGADYLVHIAAYCPDRCSRADSLGVQINHAADGSRFDRVRMRLQGGWWRLGTVSSTQALKAFERLGERLASG